MPNSFYVFNVLNLTRFQSKNETVLTLFRLNANFRKWFNATPKAWLNATPQMMRILFTEGKIYKYFKMNEIIF
jgi:hypothetical protein